MKIDREVLRVLNKCLSQYLVAINQYFLHARILKNWGFAPLGKIHYKQSIIDMKDADLLIERILLLEGLPNLQELGKLLIGEDVPEIIQCGLDFEQSRHASLMKAIQTCENMQDYVSRDLLEAFITKNEDLIDYLQTQQDQIKDLGLENYLQSIAFSD